MADWAQAVNICGLDSLGTIEVPSKVSTANQKGSWYEQSSSLPYNIKSIYFFISYGNYLDFLFDIGIGSDGNEVVIVSDVHVGLNTNAGYGNPIYISIPIHIAAGTRVSIRCQRNSTTQASLWFSTYISRYSSFFSDNMVGFAKGTGVTSDSGLYTVDPGASINTYGSWTQLVASAERNYNGFYINLGGLQNSILSWCNFCIDIGIGAAASEIVLYPNHGAIPNAQSDNIFPYISPFIPMPIAAGTRISARIKCNINDATDRLLDVGVILI